MLKAAFIEELHCPYCGSALLLERTLASRADRIEHGIVRCGCYRYPVIDGILILKQQSGPADTHDVRVAHLMAGEIEQARHRAMHVDGPLAAVPSRWHRIVRQMQNKLAPEPGLREEPPFAELLETLRPGLYAQYLYHRYANNSFLASIAPLLLLGDLAPGQRVLELTCGIGHSAFLMHALFPHLQLVATDHDFVNLSIARRHVVPEAQLVCLDAEAPLPFAEGSFGGVFCLDGFHYLRSKVALIKELNRVTEAQALWLFPHLHNARAENFNPGIALEPEHYGRCFSDVPHRIFPESSLLSDFHREGALQLGRTPEAAELSRAQNLTLIGTRRQDFWRHRTDLAPRLSKHPHKLIVNPIYRVQATEAVTRLTLSWPSKRLQEECREVEDYLPMSLELDSALLRRLRADQLVDGDSSIISELTRKFVLVNLPPAAYASA